MNLLANLVLPRLGTSDILIHGHLLEPSQLLALTVDDELGVQLLPILLAEVLRDCGSLANPLTPLVTHVIHDLQARIGSIPAYPSPHPPKYQQTLLLLRRWSWVARWWEYEPSSFLHYPHKLPCAELDSNR